MKNLEREAFKINLLKSCCQQNSNADKFFLKSYPVNFTYLRDIWLFVGINKMQGGMRKTNLSCNY